MTTSPSPCHNTLRDVEAFLKTWNANADQINKLIAPYNFNEEELQALALYLHNCTDLPIWHNLFDPQIETWIAAFAKTIRS